MIFRDIMTVLESPDKVRIIQNDKEVYAGYFANMRRNTEILNQFSDMKVKKFRLIPEIRHKEWKERNLMQPLRPDEMPDFIFSDLEMRLYHTIYI